MEYYKSCPVDVIYNNNNGGPNSVWNSELDIHRTNYFIVTDPDCLYDGVPEDWLDKMLNTLKTSTFSKVGFSLRIDDLPDNEFTNDVKLWEAKFSVTKNEFGWVADIDSTFALYKPNSSFTYSAIRLEEPYCIRHIPWYLTKETIDEEWRFYLKESNNTSSWGTRLKNLL